MSATLHQLKDKLTPVVSMQRLRSHSFDGYSTPSNDGSAAPLKFKGKKKVSSRRKGADSETTSLDASFKEQLQLGSETPPSNPIYVDLEDLHDAKHSPWSPSSRSPAYSRQASDENSLMKGVAPHPAHHSYSPFSSVSFAKSVVDLADQGINAPLAFEGPVGISGLTNVGNTCFLNAALQCLSATIPLSSHLRTGAYKAELNRHSKMGSAGYITRALARLFRVMWSQEHSHVTPLAVRDALWRFAPQFQNLGEQEDSQEVASFFLDQLHEDLNLVKVKPNNQLSEKEEAALETMPSLLASQKEWERSLLRDNSIIVRLFHGQERSRLCCLECKNTSTTWSNFNMLSLKIPSSKPSKKKGNMITLEDLFAEYVKPEMMPREDGWRCHHCKTEQAATHTLALARLPPILVLHISRTTFSDFGLMDKDDRPVQFPVHGFQPGKFMSPPAPGSDMLYDLYACINHTGAAEYGHYTAIVASQDQWYELNDKLVSHSSPKEVSKHYRSAYMLMYRLRQ